ncbi:MAG: hypothetical protein HY331_09010 [Chloroflexi bacterium]|nr:hypothetical protein [Chloroflexota bacterium]
MEPESEFEIIDELERLESLAEEMEELGVTSLDEIRRRIAEINRKLEEYESRRPTGE